MSDYLCYHHNDMDGKAAGYEVYKFFRDKCNLIPTKSMFIKRGYDEPFNEDDYRGKTVFIVDLSFTTQTITKLFMICESAAQVYWIDHHDSSVECVKNDDIRMKLESYHNLHYYVNKGASGALLTRIFFECNEAFDNCQYYDIPNFEIEVDKDNRRIIVNNSNLDRFVVNIEDYLLNVDQYDRWVYGENLNPVYFNYGVGLYYNDIFFKDGTFNSRFWESTIIAFFGKLSKEGMTVYKYIKQKAKRDSFSIGYPTTIGKYSAFVLNGGSNSISIDDSFTEKYDITVIWNYNGKSKLYEYSFYSNKSYVNCAKIAEQWGGGGHKGASGCSSKELLFK